MGWERRQTWLLCCYKSTSSGTCIVLDLYLLHDVGYCIDEYIRALDTIPHQLSQTLSPYEWTKWTDHMMIMWPPSEIQTFHLWSWINHYDSKVLPFSVCIHKTLLNNVRTVEAAKRKRTSQLCLIAHSVTYCAWTRMTSPSLMTFRHDWEIAWSARLIFSLM